MSASKVGGGGNVQHLAYSTFGFQTVGLGQVAWRDCFSAPISMCQSAEPKGRIFSILGVGEELKCGSFQFRDANKAEVSFFMSQILVSICIGLPKPKCSP